MSTIDPTNSDDDWTAAAAAQPLTRIPVEAGYVVIDRSLISGQIVTWEYRGQHAPRDGDVFTALCANCPEVHAVVLRSGDRWHVALVDEWVAE